MNTRRRLAGRGAGSPANPAVITHFLALHILALQIWKPASETELIEIKQAAHAAAQRAAERSRGRGSQPLAAVPGWRSSGLGWECGPCRGGSRPSRRNGLASAPTGAVRSLGNGLGRPRQGVRSCSASCCLTVGCAPCSVIDAAGAKIPRSASNSGGCQTCCCGRQQEPVGRQIAVGPQEPSGFSCPGRTKPKSVIGRVPALAPHQIESQLAGHRTQLGRPRGPKMLNMG